MHDSYIDSKAILYQLWSYGYTYAFCTCLHQEYDIVQVMATVSIRQSSFAKVCLDSGNYIAAHSLWMHVRSKERASSKLHTHTGIT